MEGNLASKKGVTDEHLKQKERHCTNTVTPRTTPRSSEHTGPRLLMSACVPMAAGPHEVHTLPPARVIASTHTHAPLSCGMSSPN